MQIEVQENEWLRNKYTHHAVKWIRKKKVIPEF